MNRNNFRVKFFFLVIFVGLLVTLSGCNVIKENLTNQNMYKKLNLDISGCYLGVACENDEDIPSFNAQFSKKQVLIGIFIQYLKNNAPVFPSENIETLNIIKNQNSIPFITWEPWDAAQTTINILPDILNGTYDNLIDSWAIYLKQYDWPVIIRWGHEMDGNWYPWSENAETYKQAFRYIVTRFKNAKAYNVSWIFAPNRDDGGTGRNFEDYFPGTNYVDGFGISGYNFGTTQSWSSWINFYSIYYNAVTKLNALGNLPIIIDIGSTEKGGNKAEWIADMFYQLADNSTFSSIKGLVWFNFNKETNWKVDSSETSLTAYKNGIINAYFISEPQIQEKNF
jgi:hypothetical protein